MKLHMTFKQMDATDALKSHIEGCSKKLEKYLSGDYEASWTCFLEGQQQVADIKVVGPHVDCFAQAKSDDLYRSIDEASEKAEKQLRKHKEILKNHLHRDRS
ncbi:MAG: ribosome-associated translation inhibitor RaiA [Bacteriovoracia bacterium]